MSASKPPTSTTPRPPRLAPMMSGGSPKYRCATLSTPGSSSLNAATNCAGSANRDSFSYGLSIAQLKDLPQPVFISKWIAPLGKTDALPGGRSLTMKRAPFSLRSPARRVPFTEKLISVARGWVCGVLIAHGPRKPMAAIPSCTSDYHIK